MTISTAFQPEEVMLKDLQPHPKNYKGHPEDQLEHIIESIKRNGLYRNIVIAKDGTILAGHGVTLACRKIGLEKVPVIRLDIDPDSIAALKILAGDNEISNLGEVNDRALTNILKEIGETDIAGLVGTGFDKQTLAALVMVTRPASEIADKSAAAEWAGDSDYQPKPEVFRLTISFTNKTECEAFLEKSKTIKVNHQSSKHWSATLEEI